MLSPKRETRHLSNPCSGWWIWAVQSQGLRDHTAGGGVPALGTLPRPRPPLQGRRGSAGGCGQRAQPVGAHTIPERHSVALLGKPGVHLGPSLAALADVELLLCRACDGGGPCPSAGPGQSHPDPVPELQRASLVDSHTSARTPGCAGQQGWTHLYLPGLVPVVSQFSVEGALPVQGGPSVVSVAAQ